jgi:hypothetical protein
MSKKRRVQAARADAWTDENAGGSSTDDMQFP